MLNRLLHTILLKNFLMKKVFLLIITSCVLFSCGNKNRGELIGVKQKKWFGEKPYGMTLIEGGAYIMGKSDEDQAQTQNAPAKTVTVPSFYMDETEITNSEYRQFVYWVKDSIALAMLARKAAERDDGGEPNPEGIGEFAFQDADTSDLNEFQKYMKQNYYDVSEDPYAGRPLNWDADLSWETEDYVDQAYGEVMDSLYLPPELWYNGEMKLDVTKLIYAYTWFDAEGAAAESKRNRQQFIDRTPFIKKEEIQIYPDTTVWIKDFEYSYNEPMHNDYFWHDAYSDYPVVGVNWMQAKAFCNWRTKFKNDDQKSRGKQFVNQFRLPTEAEWEYVARAGSDDPYFFGADGSLLCSYANTADLSAKEIYRSWETLDCDDGQIRARYRGKYRPNDFGVFDILGNVSEWVAECGLPKYRESQRDGTIPVDEDNCSSHAYRGGSWDASAEESSVTFRKNATSGNDDRGFVQRYYT